MTQGSINNTNPTTMGARFLVLTAARPILIEAEIRSSAIQNFVRDYSTLTGQSQSWQSISAEGHAMDMGENKWGVEVRVYFPKDQTVANRMREYGFSVDDGNIRMEDSYRINSRELFQELVGVYGLRIGYNY